VLDAPDADPVVLRDRRGGRAQNVIEEYTQVSSPALARMVGSGARGPWTLRVSDLARRDIGRFRRWTLRLQLSDVPEGVRVTSRPGLAIPDDDPAGVSDTVSVGGSPATIRVLRVGLDITHSYIGDLRVELHAPGGATARLHDETGGSADNLVVTLDSASHGALGDLVGGQAVGTWRLHVADREGADIGKLNEWWLEIERE
jgi:extracellular elastinolytic metalloproteinase